MLTCGDLGMKPEEIETLQMSAICPECDHRGVLHGEDYCKVEGCHCVRWED